MLIIYIIHVHVMYGSEKKGYLWCLHVRVYFTLARSTNQQVVDFPTYMYVYRNTCNVNSYVGIQTPSYHLVNKNLGLIRFHHFSMGIKASKLLVFPVNIPTLFFMSTLNLLGQFWHDITLYSISVSKIGNWSLISHLLMNKTWFIILETL